MSFNVFIGVTTMIPALVDLSMYFGSALIPSGWIGSMAILPLAIGPYLWIVVANIWGERLTLVIGNLIAIAAGIGVAETKPGAYSAAMGARIVMGLGYSANLALIPRIIRNLFFISERGRALGAFTLSITLATSVGPIAGGYIAANPSLGWQWTQWWPTIQTAGVWILYILFVPDTHFRRDAEALAELEQRQGRRDPTYWDTVKFPRITQPAGFKSYSFIPRVIVMFAVPEILLTSFWFGVVWMWSTAIPA